ncbi:LLM class flavin-dependent oxidoreductase, partial [Erwinia amylovora]|nr:LLM class flavin-dependent oxidoreductase [Erwinia amylovora]
MRSVRNPVALSLLDLAHVPLGATESDAFRNSLALSQQADKLGYHRLWLADHQNMTVIAIAA